MQLSKRLEAIVKLAGTCHCVADVGTDHGYIPIYMTEHHLTEKAIAMDVNKGPLERAQRNIRAYRMEQQITTRLSDGVAKLKAMEADCVIIAGMGGLLTIRILEAGKEILTTVPTMILQPQSEIDEVRRFLREQGFRIVDEDMLVEDGKYYTAMRAVPADVVTEDCFGPVLLEKKHPILKEWMQREICIQEKILNSLTKAGDAERSKERRQEVEERLRLLEHALRRME